MKLFSVVATAMLFMAPAAQAADIPDTQTVVAAARARIASTDSRATGRLVRVDANGNRVSSAFAIKAHWFPGVLRVLLEVVPVKTPVADVHQNGPQGGLQDARVRILFEMLPGGQSTIRIFHPHEAVPATLPFDRWSEGVAGSDFDYEDFLQSEFYWQGQTLGKSARLGAHDCDVLKSTPGAADRSHYAEVQTWLDRTIGYPLYVEKTLKAAATVKEFTSLGLVQSGGIWAAKQVEVKVHGRPGSTLLIFEHGSTKAHLTLKDFSPEQINQFEDHP